MSEQVKILIAVPTFENINPETFKSIYGLEKPQNSIVQFDFIKGYDCARARNEIAKEALQYKFDYVLMVDSDIVLPSQTLTSLLSHNKAICMGWYYRKRTTTFQTELFSLGMKDFTDKNNINGKSIPPTGLFEIKGGGLGISLIKCSVFTRIGTKNWFVYKIYDNGDVLSEDNYFCCKAKEAGFKIYYDASVHGGHICKTII